MAKHGQAHKETKSLSTNIDFPCLDNMSIQRHRIQTLRMPNAHGWFMLKNVLFVGSYIVRKLWNKRVLKYHGLVDRFTNTSLLYHVTSHVWEYFVFTYHFSKEDFSYIFKMKWMESSLQQTDKISRDLGHIIKWLSFMGNKSNYYLY